MSRENVSILSVPSPSLLFCLYSRRNLSIGPREDPGPSVGYGVDLFSGLHGSYRKGEDGLVEVDTYLRSNVKLWVTKTDLKG